MGFFNKYTRRQCLQKNVWKIFMKNIALKIIKVGNASEC